MPTALERARRLLADAATHAVRPFRLSTRLTGVPFPGRVIPRDRISPQAAALLGYYPLPNVDGIDGYNFQTPLLTATDRTAFSRVSRNHLRVGISCYGNVAYQRTTTAATNVFGFADANVVCWIDAAMNWSRRFSQFLSLRLRYQFTRTDDPCHAVFRQPTPTCQATQASRATTRTR